ncbi:MAG: signal transduction histidine kinase nitrogen specific [Desulfovibrionaceae bacterium]|nr:MAG: signal transduction histidine kinase nitrogen specific [Desulfovibrionaceae bacterium]
MYVGLSIKRTVILVLFATSLVTLLAGWAAVRYLGLEGFERLDQEQAFHDLGRAASGLDNELAHLDSALRFKSVSDITYRFAADRDKLLGSDTFSWESLRGAGLNLMALYDPAGKLLAVSAFDLETREAIPLDTLLKDLPDEIKRPGAVAGPGAKAHGKGVLNTPLGPMLISYQPVLNSLGWGPSRGTLLAGRFLDDKLVEQIAQQLRLQFSLIPLSKAPGPLADKARAAMRAENDAFVGSESQESLTVHCAYPDFLGIPALLLTVVHPHTDAMVFNRSMHLALGLVALAGVLSFGASILLLQLFVLNPLTRVTRHIAEIKDSRDLGKALVLDRDDEIGLLAKTLNATGADLARLYDQLDRQHGLQKLLIDNIPHPISVKDAHGRYAVANPALGRLLGRPVSELIGSTDSALGSPAMWAEFARAEELEVLRSGKPRFCEAEAFDSPFAGLRLFATSRLLLPGPGDEPASVLTVSLDVTERRYAEESLRQSERKFRTLFESMTEGVSLHEIVTGPMGEITDYRVLDVNPAFESILGIARDKAMGELASRLYGTGQAPFLDIFSRVASIGLATTFEVFFEPMDKHFHISAFSPWPGHFATVFTDTTERIRTQEALEHARTAMQHILDSMPSPVIGVDADAVVAYLNSAAARLLGAPNAPNVGDEGEAGEAAAVGLPLVKAFAPLEPYQDAIFSALAQGLPVQLHRVRLTVSGNQRLFDLQVFPMLTEGQTRGAVIRLDDVTERVRMEELVLQTEKMMSVGGLAAGMAHEINNPLGGILQSVQIVQRRLFSDLPGNSRSAQEAGCSLEAIGRYLESRDVPKFLDAIRDAGKRAAHIVSNMLEFSRRSESKMAPADLMELMEKALELASNDYDLKRKYDFRRIEIVRDYPEAPLIARCTKTEIEQVVLNIIKNAAQALASQPLVGQGPCIVLRLSQDGQFARMAVEDNGPGMDEATRKRVFEPFFTTKAPGLGTGLGLSVSYFIITQNHGGDMTVESSPGRGARFIIRLPLDQAASD